MKPEIAENGTVIRLDGGNAVIMLQGSGSCKGCGAAKMGLCKPNGGVSVVNAKNLPGAQIGDTVKVGIDRAVRLRGYSYAFFIPLFSFLAGALAGYFTGLSELDVIGGFAAFILSSFFSLKKLRLLDKSASLVITKVITDNAFSAEAELYGQ